MLDTELLVEASALPVLKLRSVVTPVCKLVGTVPAIEVGTTVPLENVYGPVWVSALTWRSPNVAAIRSDAFMMVERNE